MVSIGGGFFRACLQTLIVILNEVKNPTGPRRSPLRHLAGCFAALSMTISGNMGFEDTPLSKTIQLGKVEPALTPGRHELALA
jgi:hypothetical protein